MLLYQDIFTGKDILTDSYKILLVDDFLYEVDASYVTRKGDDFGDEMFGGNPSVEEAIEDSEAAGCVSGFDVILNHEDIEEYAEEPNYKKFMPVVKKIVKAAQSKMDADRHAQFKAKLAQFFGKGIGKQHFSNFQIYFSKGYIDEETGDILAAPILVDADETGMKAKMYYFKDLMTEVKQ
ncbi:hypothetical protein QZH41_005157 [Actinostola sp. cb2023]|nr:hypothetical protein QZH41_005157 [Actinostola sp. cb2023]